MDLAPVTLQSASNQPYGFSETSKVGYFDGQNSYLAEQRLT